MTNTNSEVKEEDQLHILLSDLGEAEIGIVAVMTASDMITEIEKRDEWQRIKAHRNNLLQKGPTNDTVFGKRFMVYSSHLKAARATYRMGAEECIKAALINPPNENQTIAEFISWFIKSFQPTPVYQSLLMAQDWVHEAIDFSS